MRKVVICFLILTFVVTSTQTAFAGWMYTSNTNTISTEEGYDYIPGVTYSVLTEEKLSEDRLGIIRTFVQYDCHIPEIKSVHANNQRISIGKEINSVLEGKLWLRKNAPDQLSIPSLIV